MFIKIPKSWEISENQVTPEQDYLHRRQFLKGLAGVGALSFVGGSWAQEEPKTSPPKFPGDELYPAKKNANYFVERALTEEQVAATYNNFYEISTQKEKVHLLGRQFKTNPWTLKIHGEVKNPLTLDLDQLVHLFPLEERIYRFRCVEAWAMTVPWTGFALSELIKKVEPTSKAKYLRFVTVMKGVDEAPGMASKQWPWPYFEALRLDEAMNELSLITLGIYGHRMPVSHGAPVRLIVPWKYGYKSPKSIVEIEFTEKKPPTFWNTCAPQEYSWLSNVEPQVPHPRWSQATERLIGSGERVPTLRYNGYEKQVASLYA